MLWSCRLLVATLFLSAGCAQATQLVVVVDTDMAIPGEVDEVRVSVTRPDGTTETEMVSVASRMALPLSVGVVAEGEELGPIDVIATGYRDGVFVIDRSARVTLVRNETRVLSLFLLANCRSVVCADGETCGEGGTCRGSVVVDLPPWTGVLPGVDAGMDAAMDDAPGRDAPAIDAFGADVPDVMTPDVPPLPCTDDTDCDDGIPCTTDSCGATGCEYQVDSSLCDDGNPCTDDACVVGSGCVPTNNTAPCSDGVFCNGNDVCAGGVCSHPGDPCSAPTTCDETMDACVGCVTRSDCPADEVGAWGACDWSGTCDSAATRSRTNVTYSCGGSGSCVATPMTETEACSRSTEGTSCGVGSCGAYGACGGFIGTCGEVGMESRSCTDLLCVSGTCTGQPRTESRACSRDTDGTGCGTSCGAWSACSYGSTCATTGTQTRTCTDSACVAGTCTGGAPRTEMQSCGTRVTDGTDCGSTCGVPGPCGGFTDVCDQTGTQTSVCTDRICNAGTCGSSIRNQMNSCSRVTTGLSCDPDSCSMGNGSCGAGRCMGASVCGGGCVCDNHTPFGSCYDPTPPYSICALE